MKRKQKARGSFAYVWAIEQAKKGKKRGERMGDQITCSRGTDALGQLRWRWRIERIWYASSG
jgi:hypothetical protein